MKQTVIEDYTRDIIMPSSMVQDTLEYLAKGLSFYDTSVKLGVTPQEVIAIYAQHRANPK